MIDKLINYATGVDSVVASAASSAISTATTNGRSASSNTLTLDQRLRFLTKTPSSSHAIDEISIVI
jgi:hypothetical protein